jgi:hypothetical protein
LFAPFARAADDATNASHRLALNFNEAMNRCLQSACSNVEEVIGFFADDGTYVDEAGQVWNGKAAIKKRLTRSAGDPAPSDRIAGIEVHGVLITLHLERRRNFKDDKRPGWAITQVNPHVQVLLLKGARITRLISVIAPDEK